MQMLCDARSTPPRIAAVLVADGRIEYADVEPSKEIMKQFIRRGDNQIASLEILSIAFGFSTFAHRLRGKRYIGARPSLLASVLAYLQAETWWFTPTTPLRNTACEKAAPGRHNIRIREPVQKNCLLNLFAGLSITRA